MSDINERATAALASARSLLFAPASDEHKLRKALASEADGLVADLEDAVAPADKAAAREVLAAVYTVSSPHPGGASNPPPSEATIPGEDAPDRADSVTKAAAAGARPLRLIRVNHPSTEWFADDVQLVRELAPDAIVFPKATPYALDELGSGLPPVIAIVETAEGVQLSAETARHPVVAALQFGAADLGAQVGLETRADGLELLYVRSKLAIDSAAAGIRGPFDVVHLETHDEAGLEEQCLLARAVGFRGKSAIHPAQIATINRLFAPSERELAWARSVVETFDAQHEGVLSLNGQMIDAPVVARARRILAEAERSRT